MNRYQVRRDSLKYLTLRTPLLRGIVRWKFPLATSCMHSCRDSLLPLGLWRKTLLAGEDQKGSEALHSHYTCFLAAVVKEKKLAYF
jgi:hypothetical protein